MSGLYGLMCGWGSERNGWTDRYIEAAASHSRSGALRDGISVSHRYRAKSGLHLAIWRGVICRRNLNGDPLQVQCLVGRGGVNGEGVLKNLKLDSFWILFL